MSDNAVAKALHDGLDRLRSRGWVQWELYDRSTGRVCARGALIEDITPETHWFEIEAKLPAAVLRADDLLCAVACEQYPDRIESWAEPIVALNNHPDTTQNDVERLFEKAIVRAYEMEAGE